MKARFLDAFPIARFGRVFEIEIFKLEVLHLNLFKFESLKIPANIGSDIGAKFKVFLRIVFKWQFIWFFIFD